VFQIVLNSVEQAWSMEWQDPTDPLVQNTLYFEKVQQVRSKYSTVCWLPYDPDYCSELYKMVITQLKFVRAVVNSQDSFTIKRHHAPRRCYCRRCCPWPGVDAGPPLVFIV
jgi:hypothetical protein